MVAVIAAEAQRLYQEDQLPEEFGWIAWLSPSHQRLFAGELYQALHNPSDSESLEDLIDAWKATAELEHDAEAFDKLVRNSQSSKWAAADTWMKA